MVAAPDDVAARIPEALAKALSRPGLVLAEEPERVQGGHGENAIFGVRLAGAPPALSGPLILRRYRPDRDPAGVRLEAALHRGLTAQGYAVPQVHAVCEDTALLGGAFMLMERLPGRILLEDIGRLDEVFATPGAALRRLPLMIWEACVTVPATLADVLAQLHAVAPEPIAAALRAEGFDPEDFSARTRVERAAARAEAARLDGLLPVFDWLRAHHTPPERPVLCHGDLQFLNVLVDGGRIAGVIDWSLEHVAFDAPDFDVGNSLALLAIRLPGLPRPARGPIEAVQRTLVRRLRHRYARRRPLDPQRLRWAAVFRYAREMMVAGEYIRRDETETSGYLRSGEVPWLIPEVQAGALAAIREHTGIVARLPEAP